jgi:transcriptional regulator with XRE-family HTH domain
VTTIVGNDVVEYRKRRNLSRKALAVEAGLTESKIWRIEAKSVITDDEERALLLAGVTALGQDTRAADPGLVTVNVPAIEALISDSSLGAARAEPAGDVDFSSLLHAASGPTYERYVSNSELQTFKTCRRKWWLAWYRGLHLIKESPIGVKQIGDRLHRALREHYVPGGPKSPSHMLDALERLIVLDRTALGDNLPEETRLQFDKEADLQRIMLEGYVQWLAETGADSELEVIFSETYVEAALHEFEDKIALIGKMDVRVRRTIDGAHLFMDHKSVGDLRSPVQLLPLDEQMLHYHLLETMGLPDDEHCDGALYNMLRRVKRTPAAKPPFYDRIEVRHNPHELAGFRRRVVGTIMDMNVVRDELDHGTDHRSVAYPRPSRDCTWSCDFFQVCSMFDDGSRVEDMLLQHYRQGDPLEYYQSEVLGGIDA